MQDWNISLFSTAQDRRWVKYYNLLSSKPLYSRKGTRIFKKLCSSYLKSAKKMYFKHLVVLFIACSILLFFLQLPNFCWTDKCSKRNCAQIQTTEQTCACWWIQKEQNILILAKLQWYTRHHVEKGSKQHRKKAIKQFDIFDSNLIVVFSARKMLNIFKSYLHKVAGENCLINKWNNGTL